MLHRVLRALDDHWFRPIPRVYPGIARIVVYAGLLLYVTLPFPAGQHTRLWYQQWLTEIHPGLFAPIPILKLMLLPFGGWGSVRPEPMFLHAVWLVLLAASLCAMLGLVTRVSLVLCAYLTTILIAHGYSYTEFHHPEALLVIALWVFALAPGMTALSVDELRSRARIAAATGRFEPRSPGTELDPLARWPLRLIQWLFVLVYLSAALSKLANAGLDWFNGYTLTGMLLRDSDFQLTGSGGLELLVMPYPEVVAVLSIGTFLFELTFAVAVLFPATAWLYVAAGTLIHVGIYILQRAPFFQFMLLYIVFAEPIHDTLRRKARARPQWMLAYDGRCSLCIRSMVLADYLDLGRRLNFVDLRSREAGGGEAAGAGAMELIAPDGRRYVGFFAWRRLARLLAPMWPLLPIFHAPLAGAIGPRLYEFVNRRRQCDGVACSVHAATPAAADEPRLEAASS